MAALSDYTYFNNRSLGGITDPNDPRALAALESVRKYDPNASFRPTYGSDNQLLGYTLDVDASKLPGTDGTGSLGPTTGHGSGADFMPRFSTVQPGMKLSDPSKVTNSSVYGKITDNTNIDPRDDPMMAILGPLAVAGFAFGAPYLASAMSNGALGAGAAAADTAGAATGAASNSDLAGGLGAGAADELANGGQMLATTPAANGTSIAVSNFLAEHGIPTQFGLSEGAVGSALSSPGLGLGGSALSRIGQAASGLLGSNGTPVVGGGGGGLLSMGGGSRGATQDAMSLLKDFYGDPLTKALLAAEMQKRKGLFDE